jgi:class 3 adenylate cyclase
MDSTERSQLNRFTLSFEDPSLESAFLDEYGRNALRVTLSYFPFLLLLFAMGLGVIMTFMPHLSFARNMLFCGLGFLVLAFFYFRFLPPDVHYMQFVLSTAGVLLGWCYAYGLIIFQGSDFQWYVLVVIITHTVSVSLALPLRFVYSVITVHLILLGFTFVAFFLSSQNTVDALLQFLSLGCLNALCVFATYQREATTRVNFLQKGVIEKREAQVAELAEFLKKMFGRYLSTEVMNSLIENPSALELGGERRQVTIMMTDLRGFTALSERLEPEKVVQMLNAYFEVMVEVVLKYNGTINEIIGDALLVIFGAPKEMPDRAQRAIACGIDMQNAMARINEKNCLQGLPELEMGIGINDTEVIVGNIGSSKRSKYAVVGSGVNITSRIESYAVGGQILISESVRQKAGGLLRIDDQRDVHPKGAESPLRIYEVGGLSGGYNLALDRKVSSLVTLPWQIPIRCTVLEGKDSESKGFEGFVVRLSKDRAEIAFLKPIKILTNFKMNLEDVDAKLSVRYFYGKVMKRSEQDRQIHMIRFTSLPPEVDAYFQALRQHAAKEEVS